MSKKHKHDPRLINEQEDFTYYWWCAICGAIRKQYPVGEPIIKNGGWSTKYKYSKWLIPGSKTESKKKKTIED